MMETIFPVEDRSQSIIYGTDFHKFLNSTPSESMFHGVAVIWGDKTDNFPPKISGEISTCYRWGILWLTCPISTLCQSFSLNRKCFSLTIETPSRQLFFEI